MSMTLPRRSQTVRPSTAYEIHGSGGRPLMLLHGAFSATGTSFGPVVPALAAQRQVIAVELPGQGHPADIDRPLSIAPLAADNGSATVVYSLMGTDLIDEYRFLVLPYIMGRGRRFFPDETPPTQLRLVERKMIRGGTLALIYQPDNK